MLTGQQAGQVVVEWPLSVGRRQGIRFKRVARSTYCVQHGAMNKGLAVSSLLLVLAGCCGRLSQPPQDQPLDAARWEFSEARASAAWCARYQTGPRYIASLAPSGVDQDADTLDVLFEGPLRVSIREAGIERYAWNGFDYSTWDVDGSTLVYAKFYRGIPGGSLVAVDLESGSVAWEVTLAHPMPQGWSAWLNLNALEIRGGLVQVWSLDGGRYLELVDLGSGQSLGWRRFPDA